MEEKKLRYANIYFEEELVSQSIEFETFEFDSDIGGFMFTLENKYIAFVPKNHSFYIWEENEND